jgi:hypothetical protein
MKLSSYPTLTKCFQLLLSDNVDSSARKAVIATRMYEKELPTESNEGNPDGYSVQLDWQAAEEEATKLSLDDLETITIGEVGAPDPAPTAGDNLCNVLNWLYEEI